MAVVAPGIVGLPKQHIEGIIDELEAMTHKLRLLTDPSFWEGYERGVEQIKKGEFLTYEQLLEKFEM